ncbi:nitronate monooxygenase [uncultured Nocardioides sp.]|mgnify:CR=1 FL=1|uniref:nitronate monooxygenase n=1 Tax=uncultured Nocardioides sp. TaxID=198441 RepID=UPI00260CA160|nr:nitronate monooxygenase [uncultured Nocardioides sp.]
MSRSAANGLRELLGSELKVVAAPMAGGPTTPALVLAAVEAGSTGFLAGGYLTAEALAEQLALVRSGTESFGVNLFASTPVPVDQAAYAAYRTALLPLAEQYGVELPAAPVEDDDHWCDKVDVLIEAAPPWVSFTFGLPDDAAAAALRRAGCTLVQTVTSAAEARAASDAGMDALVVQSAEAGGHWGTFTPERPPARLSLGDLVGAVRATTPGVPMLAAGGTGTRNDVRAALAAGADAVAVGTALLLTPEAGTNQAHRAGLMSDRGAPVTTHAFSGRPAGGLPNAFLAEYDGRAPLGYPALHHLTGPIRRAAAAQANPEHVNLWAGTGYRHATARPAAELLRELAGESRVGIGRHR